MRPDGFTSRYFTLIFCLLIFTVSAAQAQTTAFNFQGRLNDGGNAANSNYDFQFKLFDSLAGGTQVGATVSKPNLQVINGVFSAVLDFGAAFGAGNRFLEISVRPAGSPNAHVVLGARQQILAVPFAAQSANSTNSTNSLSLGGVEANGYARLNFANQGDVSAANLGSNGYLSVGGNTLQPAASYGFVKAMVYINSVSGSPASIGRCYNGVTGASTPATCGFTVTEPLGQNVGAYRINFGFSVANRFASVTPISELSPLLNFGASAKFNGTNLEVFTFITDQPNDTAPNDFMAIVY